MKVEVNMQPDDKFYVSGWWATNSDFVLESLRQQLHAASAVWPELSNINIGPRRNRGSSKPEAPSVIGDQGETK
jgi:hypothetical protein